LFASLTVMEAAHFFEGTEKLLEVWFSRQQPDANQGSGDLRTIPRWVPQAQADRSGPEGRPRLQGTGLGQGLGPHILQVGPDPRVGVGFGGRRRLGVLGGGSRLMPPPLPGGHCPGGGEEAGAAACSGNVLGGVAGGAVRLGWAARASRCCLGGWRSGP
jgi:hypothetical protein